MVTRYVTQVVVSVLDIFMYILLLFDGRCRSWGSGCRLLLFTNLCVCSRGGILV